MALLSRFWRCCVSFGVMLLWVVPSPAQSVGKVCGGPPEVLRLTAPNIFSEQQEQWLGDAMADMLERELPPLKDGEQNAYLDGIAARLLAVLPPTTMKIRVVLADSSELNALSLAGGRVYLTRKLVASARNEDEVASVIAHEMGHILTRQIGSDATADLQRLLGVTSVRNRADVYAKFQRLVDARMGDKHHVNPDSDDRQDQADRVAVYAAAAAGYRPQAYAEFWDRSFFVGGKVGNRLSNFLGSTKPTERRLRQIRALIAALPPGCGVTVSAPSDAFLRWQSRVIENQAADVVASPKGAVEVKLNPPLRNDLERLRFSRDGKNILAQDENSITVLSREPFVTRFRFDAESAAAAQFSPDSQQIVFHTPGLHVERWSVAKAKLETAREIVTRRRCLQAELSPDGRTLACVTWDDTGTKLNVLLLDVDSGQVVLEKKSWFEPSFLLRARLLLNQQIGLGLEPLPSSISADGNLLVIGPGRAKLAFDLRSRAAVKLGGELLTDVDSAFAFQGKDRIVGVNAESATDSGIFSFPDGQRVSRLNLSFGNMQPVTDGDLMLVRNVKSYAVALADLNTGRFVMASKTPAVDAWGDFLVSESGDGSLLLSKRSNDLRDAARLTLPQSRLGPARAAAISDDGRYLAFSARSRGGIWDLTTGQQISALQGFQAAWWAKDDRLLLEIPDGEPGGGAHVNELKMEPKAARELPAALGKTAHLEGGRLLDWFGDPTGGWRLSVSKPENKTVLWSRFFPAKKPAYTSNLPNNDLLFVYPFESADAIAKIHASATLTAQASLVRTKGLASLVEVVSGETGETKQQIVLETPAAYAAVSWVANLLYLSTWDNRTFVYSAAGQQLRQVFGSLIAADEASGRVCFRNRQDEAVVYDGTGTELQHLRLGEPVRVVKFLKDGARLVVLTAEQRVLTFDVKVSTETKSMVH